MQRSRRLDSISWIGWKSGGLLIVVLAWMVALGCASPAQEQNYKELEGEPQRIQPDDEDPMFGDELGKVESAKAATAPDDNSQADAVQQVPTLQGDDRAHWMPTAFYPVSGQVTHGPLYFETPNEPDVSGRIAAGPLEQRYRAALRLNEAGTLSVDNLGRAVIEPAVFYADVLLLPVRLVVTPPFSEQTSP